MKLSIISSVFLSLLAPATAGTCPSSVSNFYQGLDGVTACNVNADCAGFATQDGPPCCVYPHCICGAADDSLCVDDAPNPPPPPPAPPAPVPGRNDDDDNGGEIPVSGLTCPSSVSDFYQNLAGSQACDKDSDCAGVTSQDGPTCCIHPHCICGVADGATCVGSGGTAPLPPPAPVDPPTDRNDDGTTNDDGVAVGDDSTSSRTCPSSVSASYQKFANGRDVIACDSSSDCENFASVDGPGCCLYPQCICGTVAAGSAGNIGCTSN